MDPLPVPCDEAPTNASAMPASENAPTAMNEVSKETEIQGQINAAVSEAMSALHAYASLPNGQTKLQRIVKRLRAEIAEDTDPRDEKNAEACSQCGRHCDSPDESEITVDNNESDENDDDDDDDDDDCDDKDDSDDDETYTPANETSEAFYFLGLQLCRWSRRDVGATSKKD
jgi:hypothetical protein